MNNETLEVLKNRRSIRKYKPEQVSEEALSSILEAGTYAPTAGGKQAPVIVAVQNPEDIAKLNAMNAKVLDNKVQLPYYGAPTILLVLAPEDAMLPDLDCASVTGNLLNAAYSAGLGSCWVHRSKEMFETAEGKELLKKWNLPETLSGVCSIALGYPDCPHPEAPARKADYIVRV